jgi:hypothetical protein
MPELLVLLALWLGPNLLMSRRITAVGRQVHLPVGMLLGTIWLLPFLGAFIAFINTPSRRVVDRVVADAQLRDRTAEYGPPPVALAHAPTGTQFSVSDHLQWINELPVLDWPALERWAHGEAPAEVSESQCIHAIEQGRRAWLLHLREALGAHVGLRETDDAFVLSSLSERQARGTAEFVQVARARIDKLLAGLARFPVGHRSLVLVLDSEEDYYRYVSFYHPDGEFATSGGMFIDAGCPHFVVVRAHLQVIEPVIAHELTHSALAHLRLPRWLDEGIAVNSERRVAGPQPSLYTPHELHAMHVAYWSAAKVQRLWSGESFFRADDNPLLSYELARIMVEQMSRQWDSFVAFVRAAASASDAGAEAAANTLGVDLGAYAAALVESSSAVGWAPKPAEWP